jgi:hypothetical protein
MPLTELRWQLQLHRLLQTHRDHAQAMLSQWKSAPIARERIAQAIGQLQQRGEPLSVPRVQRAVGLMSLAPALAAVVRAKAPLERAQAIDRLRQRAATHDMQSRGNFNSADGAAQTPADNTADLLALQKTRWLQDSRATEFATDEQYAATESLLRHYQVPESDIQVWASAVWQDLRHAAQTEAKLFREQGQLPQDVLSGRTTTAHFQQRLASAENYVNYLKGDAQAYSGIAKLQLYPRQRYHALQADARNGGVLRPAELQALQREPFSDNRLDILQMAYYDARTQIARDWSGTPRSRPRPAYTEFVQHLFSNQGQTLWRGMERPPSEKEGRTLAYQARVLDFIKQTEQRAGLGLTGLRVHVDKLRAIKSSVDEQINLVRDRGLSMSGINDHTLDVQAESLLENLSARLGHAMEAR